MEDGVEGANEGEGEEVKGMSSSFQEMSPEDVQLYGPMIYGDSRTIRLGENETTTDLTEVLYRMDEMKKELTQMVEGVADEKKQGLAKLAVKGVRAELLDHQVKILQYVRWSEKTKSDLRFNLQRARQKLTEERAKAGNSASKDTILESLRNDSSVDIPQSW